MNKKIEHRSFPFDEIRVLEEDGKPIIRGHAAVFNKFSEEMFGFVEEILPGAFTKTLKEADIRALWNHNADYPLGRMRRRDIDTLALEEDDAGLAFKIDPPDTTYARDLRVSIERGDVDQGSFGFHVIKENWIRKEGKEPDKRQLIEVQLFDISPVTFPAYPDTDVGLLQNSLDVQQLVELRAKLESGKILSGKERRLIQRALFSVPAQESHTDIDKDNPPKDWQLSLLVKDLELLQISS